MTYKEILCVTKDKIFDTFGPKFYKFNHKSLAQSYKKKTFRRLFMRLAQSS